MKLKEFIEISKEENDIAKELVFSEKICNELKTLRLATMIEIKQ